MLLFTKRTATNKQTNRGTNKNKTRQKQNKNKQNKTKQKSNFLEFLTNLSYQNFEDYYYSLNTRKLIHSCVKVRIAFAIIQKKRVKKKLRFLK